MMYTDGHSKGSNILLCGLVLLKSFYMYGKKYCIRAQNPPFPQKVKMTCFEIIITDQLFNEGHD